MTKANCNCIVCAQEFNPDELQNIALSRVNITNFKVCQACLDNSDPSEDYRQVRDIIYSYLNLSAAKNLFGEVDDFLKSRKNG